MKKNMMLTAVLASGLMVGSAQAMDTLNKLLDGAVAIGTQGVKLGISAKSARTKMNASKQSAIDLLKALSPECQEAVEPIFATLGEGVDAALDPIEALIALVETINEKIVKVASASASVKLTTQLQPVKAQLVLIKNILPGVVNAMKETPEEIAAAQKAVDAEAIAAAKKPAAK